MNRYPYLLDELNGVLWRYRAMVAGFHRAREGVRNAVHVGRIPADRAEAIDRRLAKGAFCYHRASERLLRASENVWDPTRDA